MREVIRIADAAEAADGASPLDEAARMALADGAATVVLEPEGFALLHGGDLSLAVHPDHRGQGIATALLQRMWREEGESSPAVFARCPACGSLEVTRLRRLLLPRYRRPAAGSPAARPAPTA